MPDCDDDLEKWYVTYMVLLPCRLTMFQSLRMNDLADASIGRQ